MATVRIPPVLRPKTGGQAEVEAGGSDVGEVLRSLTGEFPDTQPQLFGEDGELNRYVNVYLNDEDVRVLQGLETAVKDGDNVVILPAMAGGALQALSGLGPSRGTAWSAPRAAPPAPAPAGPPRR
jgi:sulfur-carrier protein